MLAATFFGSVARRTYKGPQVCYRLTGCGYGFDPAQLRVEHLRSVAQSSLYSILMTAP